MNNTHASNVLPPQPDLLRFWLRGVHMLILLSPTPLGGNKCSPGPWAQAAWLEGVFSTSSHADGRTSGEPAPGACAVLVRAVLERSVSEVVRGRTGQSGCEGEGRGAVQKLHSAPVQVAPIGCCQNTQRCV